MFDVIDLKNITIKKDVKKQLKEDQEKTLLIYSDTSVNKNNIELNNYNYIYYSTKEVTKEKDRIDSIFKDLNSVKKIITIGGGTATDIGKYLSNKYKIPTIVVPSMLSTNAFATNKVVLIVDNKVTSLDAVTPTKIYLDKGILLNSNENNLYGLVDIFSIHIALNDWLLAISNNGESISSEYEKAKSLLLDIIDYVKKHTREEISNDVESIYYMIGESGLITNEYGSGKPESGSEHIFAKALEKEVNIPHAVSVTNGIILMIISQSIINSNGKLTEQDKTVIELLKKLNMFELNLKYEITYELISKVFKNLIPRSDRYSVINLIYQDESIKDKILEEYKRHMKEYLK